MRATTTAALTTAALLIAALVAGCGGTGGPRLKRLTGSGGDTGADGSTDGPPLPPFMCSGSQIPYNCAAPVMLNADGHLTDFSNREWNNTSGKWCDESGYHGAIYSYKNTAIVADTNTQRVDNGSFHIVLSVSAGQYGGGGLQFEGGCMDVSAFTGLKFTAAIVSGSLATCPLQVQLATFDQRPTDQNPLPGGCDRPGGASCFNFPTFTSFPVISTDPANPTQIVAPFTSFSRVTAGTLSQIVGLQWQVNASGPCMVEFALDDIGFIPAAATPPDGGTVDDASSSF